MGIQRAGDMAFAVGLLAGIGVEKIEAGIEDPPSRVAQMTLQCVATDQVMRFLSRLAGAVAHVSNPMQRLSQDIVTGRNRIPWPAHIRVDVNLRGVFRRS